MGAGLLGATFLSALQGAGQAVPWALHGMVASGAATRGPGRRGVLGSQDL